MIITQKYQQLAQNPYKNTVKIPLFDGKILCVSRLKCATFFYVVADTKVHLISAIFDWDSPTIRQSKSRDLAKLPEAGQVKLALKNIRDREIFDQTGIDVHSENLFFLMRETMLLASRLHHVEYRFAFSRPDFARVEGMSVFVAVPGQLTRLKNAKKQSSSKRISATAIWDEVLRLGRAINIGHLISSVSMS